MRTPAKTCELLEREAEAWKLRLEGRTVPQIAEAMGSSTAAVYAALAKRQRKLREEASESADEWRELHMERLEELIASLRPLALADGSQARGKTRAAEMYLKALERQAKLKGLDAPTQHQLAVGFMDLTDDELRQEAERMRLARSQVVVPALLPGEREGDVPAAVLDPEIVGVTPLDSIPPPP